MKNQNKNKIISLLLSLLLLGVLFSPIKGLAALPKVELGTTSTFAILAGSSITNAGTTTITGSLPEGGGNVGLHPGTSFTGQTNVSMIGWSAYLSDTAGIALQAKNDLITAYGDAAGRVPTTTLTAADNQLGGQTLTSGVYAFGHAATANITAGNPLILDGQGDPEAVFIFQASSDFVMASGSEIILINEARFCRVFWQVTSSATLGSGAHFVGHIFALTSITANTGATVQGQLLARNGSVTLDTNTISNALCMAAVVPENTASPTPLVSPTTTPSSTPTSSATPEPTPAESATPEITPTPTPTQTLTPSISPNPEVTLTPTTSANPEATPSPTTGETIPGGDLPKTSTPFRELQFIGFALILIGVIGLVSRKFYEKRKI